MATSSDQGLAGVWTLYQVRNPPVNFFKAKNTIYSSSWMLFFKDQEYFIVLLTGAKRREFSGMIPVITSNNHPSNPQQPIHSLRKTHQ